MKSWRPDRLSLILYASGVLLSVVASPFIMLYREVAGAVAWTPYQVDIFRPFAIVVALVLAISAPLLFVLLHWWRRIAAPPRTFRRRMRTLLLIVASALSLGLLLRIGLGVAGILYYLPTHPIALDEYWFVIFGELQWSVFTTITATTWALPAMIYLLTRRSGSTQLSARPPAFDRAI